MLVSDGALWRRQRRMAAPCFTKTAVRDYARQVAKTTETGIEELWGFIDTNVNGDAVDIDIYAGINELSLRAVMVCLFGLTDERSSKCNKNDDSHDLEAKTKKKTKQEEKRLMGKSSSTENRLRSAVSDAFQCLTEINATSNLVPVWIPTPDKAKLASAISALDEIVYALIRKKRRLQLKRKFSVKTSVESSKPSDLLSTLLDAFYESDDEDCVKRTEETASKLDKELRDELLTLLVAGQETSALTNRYE